MGVMVNVNTGNHNPPFFDRVGAGFFGTYTGDTKTREYDIKFKPSCLGYAAKFADPNDAYDWNKLFGLTRGDVDPHVNSSRFVWRESITNPGKIEIGVYTYVDGSAPYLPGATIPAASVLEVDVDVTLRYRVSVDPNGVRLKVMTTDESTTLVDVYHAYTAGAGGMVSGFYFGGDNVAPQQVDAYFSNI